jgi:hypothetical protein
MRVPVQTLLLTFSDTLGKSVALSGPSFPHILSQNNDSDANFPSFFYEVCVS